MHMGKLDLGRGRVIVQLKTEMILGEQPYEPVPDVTTADDGSLLAQNIEGWIREGVRTTNAVRGCNIQINNLEYSSFGDVDYAMYACCAHLLASRIAVGETFSEWAEVVEQDASDQLPAVASRKQYV